MAKQNSRQINSPMGVVSTQYEDSTRAGIQMLEAGGNAIDAMAASALAYMVVAPALVGIGGYGGSMLIHLASEGKTIAVDFDGVAPAAAHERMYSARPTDERSGINESEYHCKVKGDANIHGPMSVSVPGVISGISAAHAAYGRLPWKQVCAPAIRLAQEGFVAPEHLAGSVRMVMEKHPQYSELIRLWAPEGRAPQTGERVRVPEIAETLRAVAEEGWEVLYSGRIGRQIASYVQAQGGILTAQDMADYQARIQEPLRISYRGYEISTPQLAHGGLTVLQLLKILEHFELSGLSPVHPEYLRLFTEAARAVWRDRVEYFGDPDFVPVDQQHFISEDYTGMLAERIRTRAPEPPSEPHADVNTCTVHLSIADREHNLVSLTETHGGTFGAFVTVPGIGVTLSHGMCRFDPQPGRANSIAPRKRMLNNMCPLIITKDGKPCAALGAPGGRTIISTNAHLVVALLDFGLSIGEAMAAPRFHTIHDTPVGLGERHPEESVRTLEAMGYPVRIVGHPGGKAQGVVVNPDGTHSAANPEECDGRPMAEGPGR